MLKFKNRTELSDYLMLKYDNSWGPDTAHTFIMENSDLMDGWRILDEQKDEMCIRDRSSSLETAIRVPTIPGFRPTVLVLSLIHI